MKLIQDPRIFHLRQRHRSRTGKILATVEGGLPINWLYACNKGNSSLKPRLPLTPISEQHELIGVESIPCHSDQRRRIRSLRLQMEYSQCL